MRKRRLILDLCGGTGSWSRPYAEAGYDVRLITLPDWDVRKYAKIHDHDIWDVHGILAAPPCDHFSSSGAQYWKKKNRDGRTKAALAIVDACLDMIDALDPDWWAVENPIGRLRHLREERLGPVSMQFDPCDYGDPWTKRTLLWGRFNPPKKSPVEPVRTCPQGSWLQRLSGPAPKTKVLRGMTPPGFARAFFKANP